MSSRISFKVTEEDLNWLIGQVNDFLETGEQSDEIKDIVNGIKETNPEANALIGSLANLERSQVAQAIVPTYYATIMTGLIQRIVEHNSQK